ncbi:MAG: DedA family protein, partial [Ferruginibacter sp.]
MKGKTNFNIMSASRWLLLLISFCTSLMGVAQSQGTWLLQDQYERPVPNAIIKTHTTEYKTNQDGLFTAPNLELASIRVIKTDYDTTVDDLSRSAKKENILVVQKQFSWKDLLTPMFYITFGGLWLLLLIVFAETGLFMGFFLPGDSLLFVAGIYSHDLIRGSFGFEASAPILELLILGAMISICGILGNAFGYWFGKKSGPFLFERKDTFFFKKKYLYQAKAFYDKHGGSAIVMARFLPIVRTFAPIVAGIVQMDAKKFSFYNIVGSIAWVFS